MDVSPRLYVKIQFWGIIFYEKFFRDEQRIEENDQELLFLGNQRMDCLDYFIREDREETEEL